MINQFLEDWKYIGIFGNANIAMKQDWIEILRTKVETVSGVFDSERSLCLKTDSLQIEILYSTVGFVHDLQTYVVGV
jgi:hypothetical protein